MRRLAAAMIALASWSAAAWAAAPRGGPPGGARSGPIYISAEAVGDAQEVLERTGHLEEKGYTRGELDAATRGALREFQREHFLRPTGQIDSETMAVLESHRRPHRRRGDREPPD